MALRQISKQQLFRLKALLFVLALLPLARLF